MRIARRLPARGDVLDAGRGIRVVLSAIQARCGARLDLDVSFVCYWSDRFSLGIDSRACSLRAWRRWARGSDIVRQAPRKAAS